MQANTRTIATLSTLLLCTFACSSAPTEEESVESSEDAIVGGVEASNATYTVAIQAGTYPNDRQCSGALIRNNIVLTAAHCVAGTPANLIRITPPQNIFYPGATPYYVNGAIYLQQNPPSVWTIAANALVVHPNYVPSNPSRLVYRQNGAPTTVVAPNLGHDIALVRLSSPVQLPTLGLAGDFTPNENLTAVGYDFSDLPTTTTTSAPSYAMLNSYTAPFRPRSGTVTARALWNSPLTPGYYDQNTAMMVTAGPTGQFICAGRDAGGPLVRMVGSSPRVVGIALGTTPSCGGGGVAVYASVPALRGWIAGTMAAL